MQITFRNLTPSDAIKADISKRVSKLEQVVDQITNCRVLVTAPHKHHHKGNLYQIKIDVSLPGEEILTTRHSAKQHTHEDIYIAIRDAFKVTRRQLHDYLKRKKTCLTNNSFIPKVIDELY